MTTASALRFDKWMDYDLSSFIAGRTIHAATLTFIPIEVPVVGTSYAANLFASSYNPATLTYATPPRS